MLVDSIRSKFAAVEAGIAAGPLVPQVSAAEIRSFLAAHYPFTEPIALETIAAEVERMLGSWQVQVTHPRYLGLFNPSVTLPSVVADTLVAMYNPQLANWGTSPAANEIERHTLGWLASRFGLPCDSIATFTSGGMEANLSAAVVALTRAFPAYGEGGLCALPGEPTIYLTSESHHGFHKIAHLCGLGRRALRVIPTDNSLRMDVDELRRRVAEDRQNGSLPFMVVANAGTTGAGVIDPLPAVAESCRESGLWFHVDAAWGGAAVLSPRLKPYLLGIEQADSITCDAHKWFSVSMGAGMFFCRHRGSVAEAFRADVSYMPGRTVSGSTTDAASDTDATFNPFTHSAQWSRRFIGLKLFMSLAERGEAGYAAMIDHQAGMADLLRERLAATGWTVVNSTPLPLVCFTRPGLHASTLLAALRERQIAWMSEAVVPGQNEGKCVLRACITSYHTSSADIEAIVDAMNAFAAEGDREHQRGAAGPPALPKARGDAYGDAREQALPDAGSDSLSDPLPGRPVPA